MPLHSVNITYRALSGLHTMVVRVLVPASSPTTQGVLFAPFCRDGDEAQRPCVVLPRTHLESKGSTKQN